MNWLNTAAILLIAFLAIFLESYVRVVRNLLGAQIDLLPALVVYAALSAGIATVTLLATLGGLWFDSLSANPLGITVLPLLVIGLLLHSRREVILREQLYAQFVLGLAASGAAPLFTVLALLGVGAEPLLGWWSLWQWAVMTLSGGAFTPVCFRLFGRFNRAFAYQPLPESSFRPDREIKRDRGPHLDY
jgi:cell shape-determining protein MreD